MAHTDGKMGRSGLTFHSFIHSFNQHLLSDCLVPDHFLAADRIGHVIFRVLSTRKIRGLLY